MSGAASFLVILSIVLWRADARVYSILQTGPAEYEVVEGLRESAPVYATFHDRIHETGWAFLEIHGQEGVIPDDEMAFMAGKIEGALTGELIYMHYANTFGMDYCPDSGAKNKMTPSSDFCDELSNFLNSNELYLQAEIDKNPYSDYWYQVSLYLKQLEGLQEGYYSNSSLPKLPTNAFSYIQIAGDLDALQSAFDARHGKDPNSGRVVGSGSCSAFIKLLPNHADLYVAHDTWDEYVGMLRIFKLYDLPYSTFMKSGVKVPGSIIAMSSYPGKLQSEDDFYMISTDLTTLETTIGNSNPALWSEITPMMVWEPLRTMVANRLAQSGDEWVEMFARHNSGTYNNQWMVVDYKLFGPHQPLPDTGLLWVLEQLPGYIVYADQTSVLLNQTYWGSYNIPVYSTIFEEGGGAADAAHYGDWFTHDGSPRAKIFARNHTGVHSMDTMLALMRYNNFQHDPLSACNCTPPYSAENAISARSDLNPKNGTYPFDALGHRSHGGTDSKVTSYGLMQSLSCVAVAGPTHDQQPVFQWSTAGLGPRPLGHPDTFDFEPLTVTWSSR